MRASVAGFGRNGLIKQQSFSNSKMLNFQNGLILKFQTGTIWNNGLTSI